MKKFLLLLLNVIVPVFLIVGGYIIYDLYFSCFKNPEKIGAPLRQLSPKERDFIRQQSQKIAKLPRRHFIKMPNGKEVLEIEFTKILVLDVGGDGVSLCGLSSLQKCSPKKFFDFDQDEIAEQMPILGEDDVILVWNETSDKLKNGAHVIGTYFADMPLKEQQSSFDILRHLVGNKKQINMPRTSLPELSFWNFNKLSGKQKENIKNIKSIDLKVYPHQKKDSSGNIIGDYINVEFADGTASQIYEVWLQNDPMVKRAPREKFGVKLAHIPNISGVGKVPALQDAVFKDETGMLGQKVYSYMHEQKAIKRLSLLNDIIYAWANVTDVPLQSRVSEQGWNYIGDARKLVFLEKFMNRTYQGTISGNEISLNPTRAASPYIWKAYDDFYFYLQNVLDKNGVLSPLYENLSIRYNSKSKKWEIDSKKISAFRKMVEVYYLQNGAFETKMMLWSFYRNWVMPQNPFIKFYPIDKIKSIGHIIDDIDLKNIETMVYEGTARNDTLYGRNFDDNIFLPLTGDDVLYAGEGDDVYLYRPYDGFDTIFDKGGKNQIVHLGAVKKVTAELDGKDLLLFFNYVVPQNGIDVDKNMHGMRIKNYTSGKKFFLKSSLLPLPLPDGRIAYVIDVLLRILTL